MTAPTKPIFRFIQTRRVEEHDDFDELKAHPLRFVDLMVAAGHKIGAKNGPGILCATIRPGGRIVAKDVVTMTGFVCDVDSKEIKRDPEEVLALLPWIGVAHSTFSNSPERATYRVILPLKEEVSPTEFLRLWYWMNARLGGVLDPMTKSVALTYHQPRRAPDSDPKYHWIRKLHGVRRLSVHDVPGDFVISNQKSVLPPRGTRKAARGLHTSQPTLREALDALDALAQMQLTIWMADEPDSVSREVWRGWATNAVAVAACHPKALAVAEDLFVEISEGYYRYSETETRRTFQDAIESVAQAAPMTWEHMLFHGLPEEVCAKARMHGKAPVVVARKIAARIRAKRRI